jgi:nitrous oxidase accessory protein NosD
LTVQGVSLSANIEGIVITQSSSPRVINNTIDGGARGVVGIFVGEISSAKIKGNVITGHSGAGIDISSYNGSASMIVLNCVTKNGTGLIYSDYEATPITIRDNEFSDNVQDGVSISRSFASLTLDLNTIKRNGRNGVSVSGLARGPLVIADNVVDDNGSQGIALANFSETAPYRIQIIDNEVLNNAAVDLFWDGTGTNTCWKFNTFGSSDPAALPACP